MATNAQRKSAIQHTGPSSPEETLLPTPRRQRPQSVRFRSKDEVHLVDRYEDVEVLGHDTTQSSSRHSTATPRTISSTLPSLPDGSQSIMYRLGAVLFALAAIVPFLQASAVLGQRSAIPIQGVSGAAIPEEALSRRHIDLERRDDSPTDVCLRWAQQSAIINGTIYLYGGEATTQYGQTKNTWNNYFLTLDLSKDWSRGAPSLKGLPQPSGPPAVALGTLWNSYDSLYLYGGEFSSNPWVDPTPFSLWEYDIKSQQWIEHSNPETSAGHGAPSNGQPVQRAAEGAAANVPSLGRGFYFGGHIDPSTEPGWDHVVWWRVYLQSLLEFTFPGYSNEQVSSLSKGGVAGSDGVYRNITAGGQQADIGFTQRADGLLIYVPGFGDEGILLALAGGTNVSFTPMNSIDIYDIATSSWYTQTTSGPTPKLRVNPCAVIAAAQDGSSYNIYMFGGQNLIPTGNQTQFSDMWILSLPSFTWIEVDQSGQSVPYGRSGATCNVWDAQMVMVGGYIGNQLTCEPTDVYVYDLSNLQWVQKFTALSATAAAADSGGSPDQNPLNQQPNQKAHGSNPGGLEGSYGYEVPNAVISVIGGAKTGGATLTTPAVAATAGPLKTGTPVTYTVTASNGVTTTETAAPGTRIIKDSGKSGPNVAAIVVGVVCGLLAVVIAYLLFCLYLYRKRLALYKRHVEMSQRQARGEKPPAIPGLWATNSETSTERPPKAGVLGGETSSKAASKGASKSGNSTGQASSTAAGYQSVRRSSEQSSTEDLLAGQEPTFVGVMLHPRRSLRVTNRD